MKWLNNERGNAAIFMLWLLGIVAIIFVLTINIVKVYIVKEHSSLSAEQAALAGTAVLIENTAQAIENYERNPNYLLIREIHELAEGKSYSEQIEDKKNQYLSSGSDESTAYIKAVNEVLTQERLIENGFLKQELRRELSETKAGAEALVRSAVMNVINSNHARTEDTEISFSLDKWRVEVESTVRFESVSDNKYISRFIEDIPQKGYGPTLAYMENVYASGMNFPELPEEESE
ncbi:hypothetical protein [Bacillus mesophilum]|uniref:Uncharacterized protein n=1 Tax=Bacillus mesophilum TaxID=1071718 RepID=A0A7V7RIK2_9BACI|nr:hypothetical protein [Bacillus mesophilum]KAB2330090.1 hypothetical protein F7732_20110 [Bacillus mesophilum]